MIQGFIEFGKMDVKVLSRLPLTRKNCTQFIIKPIQEKWRGINIQYLPFLNLPLFGNIVQIIAGFVYY